MDGRVVSLLPQGAKSLVDRIESYAGLPIEIRQHDTGRGVTSVQLNEENTTILLPDYDEIDPEAVVHELLHIERNWPDQVPQLFSTHEDSPEVAQCISSIDNRLEHLVIVPLMERYGFDPTAFPNREQALAWDPHRLAAIKHPGDRRLHLLLAWLSVDFLVSNEEVRALALSVLAENGLREAAFSFSSAVKKVRYDKPLLASAAANFLPLPAGSAQLIVFDIRQRRRFSSPVPAWSGGV